MSFRKALKLISYLLISLAIFIVWFLWPEAFDHERLDVGLTVSNECNEITAFVGYYNYGALTGYDEVYLGRDLSELSRENRIFQTKGKVKSIKWLSCDTLVIEGYGPVREHLKEGGIIIEYINISQ